MATGEASLTLAIDLGTSSVRTALFDGRARRVKETLRQIEYSVTHSARGEATLDPATLEDGLRRCLAGTLEAAGKRRIGAVGISCFWHSLIGVDGSGDALTPVYTWADARCRDDAAALRREISEEEYHARTGCMLRASYWPAKLRWLARTEPALWKQVARWQSPAEWLLNRFCAGGGETCAHGMATGTGLYDPTLLAWDAALIKRCGLRLAQLPRISEEPLRLRAQRRSEYPALAEAAWWPAIGDGAAGNLGSGATSAGRAAINVGTSAAFRVMREGKPKNVPIGLFCYRVDARRYVVGGAVSNAGNLRAWCQRELNLPDDEAALDRALSKRTEPMQGLVVLPFWSAERAPTWCEEIGGTVVGLSQNTTALDLLQATTEAVYQRLALIADLSLPKKGGKPAAPTEIVVAGGILKSKGLLQRLADVLGRTVHASREPEASLRGAAVYALERAGTPSPHPGSIGVAVNPRPGPAATYAGERARQRRLEGIMTDAGPL